MHDTLVENLLLQWANHHLETFKVLVSTNTLSTLPRFKSEIIGFPYLIESLDHTVCFRFEKKYMRTVMTTLVAYGIPFEISQKGNLLLYGMEEED